MGSDVQSRLVLRADASSQIGAGHVMRCLSLGQAWHDMGGQAIFVASALSPPVHQRLLDEGFEVRMIEDGPGGIHDARQVVDIAMSFGAPWIVADGYHFNGAYQQFLRNAGRRVLLIDDYGHADKYAADIVLNQNLHADAKLYHRRSRDTQLLLGARYVSLRREFRQHLPEDKDVPAVAHRVLVTMGGSDPANVTARTVEAIQQTADAGLEAIVVIGADNPHRASLQSLVEKGKRTIQLLTEVRNMPELMSWADVAIAAGGTTTWERAFLGLPSLIVVLADNQRDIAESAAYQRLALNLGDFRTVTADVIANHLRPLLADRTTREEMARCGRRIIDGRGAQRVATVLLKTQGQLNADLLFR